MCTTWDRAKFFMTPIADLRCLQIKGAQISGFYCIFATKFQSFLPGKVSYFRGAGTYLNILWTNQVCLKLGVDKIQKYNTSMASHSKIGHFQGKHIVNKQSLSKLGGDKIQK